MKLCHVAKTYQAGAVQVTALKDISLEIPADRFSVIIGASGSGKTTLLNVIGCIDTPTRGSVEVCRQDVSALDDNSLTDFRACNIGFIFRNFSLMPVLSAAIRILSLASASAASCRAARLHQWPPRDFESSVGLFK